VFQQQLLRRLLYLLLGLLMYLLPLVLI
jgi:hypothetical protein